MDCIMNIQRVNSLGRVGIVRYETRDLAKVTEKRIKSTMKVFKSPLLHEIGMVVPETWKVSHWPTREEIHNMADGDQESTRHRLHVLPTLQDNIQHFNDARRNACER